MSFRILPESRSTQMALRVLPSAGAVVIQTCLPSTTGDDQPLPGMGVFQVTFSFFFSSQVIGRPVAFETPEPLGPRNIVPSSSARAGAGGGGGRGQGGGGRRGN